MFDTYLFKFGESAQSQKYSIISFTQILWLWFKLDVHSQHQESNVNQKQ